MLPGDLTNLMQILSLAVAVGCGAPALIYLFTKRENRKQKLESVSLPLIQDETKQLVPVIFKGYIYMPQALFQFAVQQNQPKPKTMDTQEPQSPGAKRLISRVGE